MNAGTWAALAVLFMTLIVPTAIILTCARRRPPCGCQPRHTLTELKDPRPLACEWPPLHSRLCECNQCVGKRALIERWSQQ